ncbi:unnamed protein product [Bursaphelenchus xylophilus]|uniref:CCR4-NOT transcription complex subunit 11 n=1 Tax=Bursaphelenchus xylophilus TaxID=6326 RepID=A0A1I7SB86_BURXY|nr:unnamed protein product [Bursaphelenchus xylophilus]CAG9118662.1 unnamed protein product [Bursaphelenchus xylophilus]
MNSMENTISQKDFDSIVSLFNYKEARLSAIGDQFLQHFRQKNATMLCMCLVALYEEHSFVSNVTQRLTISYLIYRLKDLWKPQITEKSGIFSHPYLVVLLKIFWNYVSPTGLNSNDRSLIHLLGQFPKITAQECHFVGRMLTENPNGLAELFEQSPIAIADNPVTEQTFNVIPIKTFVEEQLHQFRCFSGTPRSADADPRVISSFSILNNPILFAELEKILYTLVPPNRVSQSTYSPPRFNGYQKPGVSAPVGSRADSGLGQSVGQLQRSDSSITQNLPQQPVSAERVNGIQPIGSNNGLAQITPIGQPINGNGQNQEPDNKTQALQWLRKITSGQALHKGELQRLMSILEDDPSIWTLTEFDVPQFAKMIELHPELASECLLQEHMSQSPLLTKHINVVLTMEISVQTMVSVSRFMCQCEKLKLAIPGDFLNAYITYCIDTCQRASQNNPSAAHRMVRMVCVFFLALLRLGNFNIKPRIAEIFNFATLFSSVKETSQLYQAITQLKNSTSS